MVLQSCFCPGFRVFHCCEGCGDKWASYHPCVTDMNNGRPTAKEAPESREERGTEQIQRGLRERDAAFFVFPRELPASLRFAEGVYVHIRSHGL